MLTFTITTSTKLASISLFEDDLMIGNININVKKTHSTNIVEQVSKIFEWTDKKISDVNNVIISKGPGSFTGIRIALAFVKGVFSLDENIKFYTVNELDALQYMARDYADIVVAGIDSRKGKIYASVKKDNKKILEDGVYNIDEIVTYVSKYDESVTFVGDIYVNYKEKINHKNLIRKDDTKTIIDSKVYYEMYLKNLLVEENLYEIVPEYLEKSQAEKDYNNGNS